MKIRNRLADINALQVHVLQDYFRMTVDANFSKDEWKPLLLNKVKENKDSKYTTSYSGAWGKIYSEGIENYSIDDMDTTIIDAILKGSTENPFFVCRIGYAYSHIHEINKNRNTLAHLAENETETKILQLANESLDNLNGLVSEVANAENCSVPKEVRDLYARKYRSEIKALRLQFENDYVESIESILIERSIKQDIKTIKNSRNPQIMFLDFTGKYLKNLDKEGRYDYNLMNKFMLCAADEGIIWAYSWVGDWYFDGNSIEKNYVKASEYYEKGFDNLTSNHKLKLASIYRNNLSGSLHSNEEVISIIKSCENPRWEIYTYASEDGYEFYTMRRKMNKK